MKKCRLIFVDTSAHFAIANKKDPDHEKANGFLKKLAKERYTLLITNFILSETYTLMLRKIGREKAIEYIENLKKSSMIVRVSAEDEKKAWEIICQYKDKDFSYVDATSFVVMERLGAKKTFAFDDHFKQYGFVKVPNL
ncbi:PIN domain-containing protein [bacterium]|nr:PIN domain-containing protein [bacterium]MBU1599449.1 PIN domain-containing protein [bacterium]